MAERQTADTLDGIRADHVGRYRHAVDIVRGEILDAACGCGYGSFILAESGCRVRGVDRDADAIRFAREHYAHPRASYMRADVSAVCGWFDWVVCFETLEHVIEDGELLGRFARIAPRLLVSVPNQVELPFVPARFPFHVRHYTPGELHALLRGAGWRVDAWSSQPSRTSAEIRDDRAGVTLIARCSRHST